MRTAGETAVYSSQAMSVGKTETCTVRSRFGGLTEAGGDLHAQLVRLLCFPAGPGDAALSRAAGLAKQGSPSQFGSALSSCRCGR